MLTVTRSLQSLHYADMLKQRVSKFDWLCSDLQTVSIVDTMDGVKMSLESVWVGDPRPI
jgi:hypothetical protein